MDSGKDDVKKQFTTREGTYRLMTLSEYSRPSNRAVVCNNNQATSSPQVKISFVQLPDPNGNGDRICFNYGKELYVYVYKGIKKAPDLTKPIDKKQYNKGVNPTCHDFNTVTMKADSVWLLIGFSTGLIQLIDPINNNKNEQLYKVFNDDRLIDKTKVTCIHWVPGSSNMFLVSHASGNLYVYNEELQCGNTPPSYQSFKQGDGYAIHTCKTKTTRNPLYRWAIGTEGSCINEFAFSPCGTYLAVVSQDGYLRVFQYNTMELIGMARSYFGGFLCVCWSPDARYIVVGGEDDLITVWSFNEKRVVARGQGHKSWVTVVAFDKYTTSISEPELHDFSGSDDEGGGGSAPYVRNAQAFKQFGAQKVVMRNDGSPIGRGELCGNRLSTSTSTGQACYRLGSVSQDTQLCLWDLTEDVLRQPYISSKKNRNSSTGGKVATNKHNNMMNGEHSPAGSISQPKNKVKIENKVNHYNSLDKKLTNSRSNNINISLSNTITGADASANESLLNNIDVTITNAASLAAANFNSRFNSGAPSVVQVAAPTTANATTNTFTQRLFGFSFGDKKEPCTSLDRLHKRNFSLVGSVVTATTATTTATTTTTVKINSPANDKGGNTTSNVESETNWGSLSSDSIIISNSGNGKRMNSKTGDSAVSKTAESSTTAIATNKKLSLCDPMRLIGTPYCPRFDECPVLEPLICKKIAHERLTGLVFREDCFVVACQDGCINTWARPGVTLGGNHMNNMASSPNTIVTPMGTGAGPGGGSVNSIGASTVV